MSKPTIDDISAGTTWSREQEYRLIVPANARGITPKLQQAWRCWETGEIRWETVERVVVSDAEFFAA